MTTTVESIIVEVIIMEQSGVFTNEVKVQKKRFFYRLVPSYTRDGGVAVEAVDEGGKRIALLCRISTDMGIERYEEVPRELGFPMNATNDTIKVASKPAW